MTVSGCCGGTASPSCLWGTLITGETLRCLPQKHRVQRIGLYEIDCDQRVVRQGKSSILEGSVPLVLSETQTLFLKLLLLQPLSSQIHSLCFCIPGQESGNSKWKSRGQHSGARCGVGNLRDHLSGSDQTGQFAFILPFQRLHTPDMEPIWDKTLKWLGNTFHLHNEKKPQDPLRPCYSKSVIPRPTTLLSMGGCWKSSILSILVSQTPLIQNLRLNKIPRLFAH